MHGATYTQCMIGTRRCRVWIMLSHAREVGSPAKTTSQADRCPTKTLVRRWASLSIEHVDRLNMVNPDRFNYRNTYTGRTWHTSIFFPSFRLLKGCQGYSKGSFVELAEITSSGLLILCSFIFSYWKEST